MPGTVIGAVEGVAYDECKKFLFPKNFYFREGKVNEVNKKIILDKYSEEN